MKRAAVLLLMSCAVLLSDSSANSQETTSNSAGLDCTGSYKELLDRYIHPTDDAYNAAQLNYNEASREYQLAFQKLERLHYDVNYRYLVVHKRTLEDRKADAMFLAGLAAQKVAMETGWYAYIARLTLAKENLKGAGASALGLDSSTVAASLAYAIALEKGTISSGNQPALGANGAKTLVAGSKSAGLAGATGGGGAGALEAVGNAVVNAAISAALTQAAKSEVLNNYRKVEAARQAFHSAYNDFTNRPQIISTNNVPLETIAAFDAQKIIVDGLSEKLRPLELAYSQAETVHKQGVKKFFYCLDNRPPRETSKPALTSDTISNAILQNNANVLTGTGIFSGSKISFPSYGFDTSGLNVKLSSSGPAIGKLEFDPVDLKALGLTDLQIEGLGSQKLEIDLSGLDSFKFDDLKFEFPDFSDLEAELESLRPRLTAVSPNRGPIAGGTTITISTANFSAEIIQEIQTTGARLYIGSVPVSSFSFGGNSTITAVTPGGTLGPALLSFVAADGTLNSNVAFHYTKPDGILVDSNGAVFADQTVGFSGLKTKTVASLQPTLSAISPGIGPSGGGTAVTLTGTNFTPETIVIFGGRPALSVRVLSPTSLTAVSPPSLNSTEVVWVMTENGPSISNVEFAYDEALQKTKETIEVTERTLSDFHSARRTHLFSNAPKITGFLSGQGLGAMGGMGGISFASPFGNIELGGSSNSVALAYSGSLSQVWAKMDAAEAESKAKYYGQFELVADRSEDGKGTANGKSQTLTTQEKTYGYLSDVSSKDVSKAAQRRGYDIWTQIYGSRSFLGTSESTLFVGYLGAHRFVSPNLIIGAMVQLDWSEQENKTTNSSANGLGWMIGPYVSAKLPGQPLFFDARAAWGKSNNKISPSNTYTDSYSTERWMISGKVSGAVALGEWTIRPGVAVSYFEEKHDAYTDSLANTIPAATFSQGEVRVGPTFTRTIKLDNGAMIQPTFGVSGIWNFNLRNDADPYQALFGGSDIRARLDAGFTLTKSGRWLFDLHGFYDGLGVSNYYSYGGRARVTVRLN